MTESTELRKKQADLVFGVTNYYEESLVVDRAKGLRVFDKDGRSYLDFFGGILTISLGHCEERVTDEVVKQLGRVQHTSAFYPNEWMIEVAERLSNLTPGGPKKTCFSSSGSEANETAVALARMHTGNFDLVALRHGFSGRTMLTANLGGMAPWRQPSLIPGITHAHAPYCYRCPFGLSYPDCGVRCARDIEELIQTTTNGRVAGLLAEPILGVAGCIVPPPEYFAIAVAIVREHGGLFIADEVQTGFGRTGEKWFAIEHFGVEPDVMTFAKGLANGFPIAATVARADVAASWRGRSFSTFGGNPVSMVAARATLDVLQAEDMPARTLVLGARLRQGLRRLSEICPLIGDVRGMGLFQALELVKDRQTKEPAPQAALAVLEAARRHGVLLGRSGLYGNVLRLAPPMLVEASEIDEALEALELAFREVQGSTR